MNADALRQKIDQYLEKLGNADLNQVYNYLSNLLFANEESNERPACPHCESSLVIKYGIKRGKQRYYCQGCKKTFVATRIQLYTIPISESRRGRNSLRILSRVGHWIILLNGSVFLIRQPLP